MLRSIAIACLVLVVTGQTVEAQKLKDRLKQRPNARVKVDNSDDKRNDLEGTIWEYKVIDARTKKTMSTGKVRIKKTAIFAVATKKKTDGKADTEVDDKPIKNAIAKRIAAKSDEDAGGERIGDIVTNSKKKRNPNEYTFRFDKDDEHELSGIAVIKRDTKNKGGVWLGYYNDAKKKRWRFEMRKIED